MATTEFVEVTTKEAAEKELKSGKSIRIVSGRFALAVVGLSGVDIELSGSTSISLSLTDSSPRIVARGTSSPRIVAWGTSSPTIVAWETSSPRIEAWETSSPTIVARGTSSPRIVAWETSSPRIVAWGTSSPTIEAWGYSMIQTSGNVTGSASVNVSVNLRNGGKIDGGKQTIIDLKTPQDWCDYYGVRVENGIATTYKAVGDGYISSWKMAYTPGTMPSAPDWDGGKRECGNGLHFSPTPHATHQFVSAPKHYLECKIRLSDMAVHFDGDYPGKCKAKEICEPLIEVDIDGKPIVATRGDTADAKP